MKDAEKEKLGLIAKYKRVMWAEHVACMVRGEGLTRRGM
jgi:hypothetical protein